ncbi:hypothetical protein NIES4102_17370 [Chondrocystis sp. NIES-4102]|nr:hypothetical protein NIES4102_17370 [Chondrocystis sp. NIES-4102]
MVKGKLCDLCKDSVMIRYRIQYQKSGDWVMVCPECWQKVSQNNPDYRYGGTWKAKR